MGIVGIIASIIAFSIIIIIHEAGHMFVARRMGIKVETFVIGFGRPFLKFSWKGTEYGIAPFPLGGYVRMKGEPAAAALLENRLDLTAEELELRESVRTAPDSYGSKKFWQKLLVLLSGAGMNLISAFFVLWVITAFYFRVPLTVPTVGSISPGSAAAAANLRIGDTFVAYYDGSGVRGSITNFNDIPRLRDAGIVRYVVLRDGNELSITMRPTQNTDAGGNISNAFGFDSLSRAPTFIEGLRNAGLLYVDTLSQLGKALSSLFSTNSINSVSGPIGIIQASSQVVNSAVSANDPDRVAGYLYEFLYILALISINLGIINLLPIVPLDGGNILLEALAPLLRKYNSLKAMAKYLSLSGIALIFALMLFTTVHDFGRLVHWF